MSKVGVYKIDITPPLGIEFIGYHRPSGVTNVDERIYATAFVFESDKTKSVFISVDNIGMLVEDTTFIRRQIADEIRIPIQQITVVYTHTHSGPATVSESQIVKSYKMILVQNVVKAAVYANDNLQPSEVGWNVTMGEIGVNRREPTPDGKVKMGTNEHGFVDKRIGMLAIRQQDTDELTGAIVFCTAHPNVLMKDSDILSADYPGLSRKILESTLTCPVIIVQGASGDVNAKYRGSIDALRQMAFAVSGNVLSMIPTISFQPITNLNTDSITFPMKLKEIPGHDELEKMAARAEEQWGVNTSSWLGSMVEKYEEGERQLTIDLEVQIFRVNEGSFSGIPMEPFSETALVVQEDLHTNLAFFGGYTNGYLGYLPTREAHPFGGYEVELNPIVYGPITGLWMPAVEDTAEKVVGKVLELHRK
ncbi:neutral/alkaline non-lysosomal ceramidase N-terminal domain-containing protein [Rossellomorea aquimaris]|uniref:neutral/alkaline non-lysosomal ceramidase N-terminal domain-containing protein n=1 Tax=Rossellomorea aquimaris TaxID=189382 RepID=UPI001CD6A29D|nr:neutral/alkaline non-lysosomal ceramidase N-terminal domain-containing protein [Rossellomorea aquimaris]MCA1054116.1 neutral/alkaline non-lysosomal ceramidase N-terminal domain-containing protein [Rossellomorea aquimaris]